MSFGGVNSESITGGAVHEVNALDVFPLESGSYYVMDKAYIDFGRLNRIHKGSAFFVTRDKENFKFVRLSSRLIDRSTGVRGDQTVRLRNKKVLQSYPEAIRRLKYYDAEIKIEFVFITNNFEISPLEIYIALITYLMLMIVKLQFKLKQTQYEIL